MKNDLDEMKNEIELNAVSGCRQRLSHSLAQTIQQSSLYQAVSVCLTLCLCQGVDMSAWVALAVSTCLCVCLSVRLFVCLSGQNLSMVVSVWLLYCLSLIGSLNLSPSPTPSPFLFENHPETPLEVIWQNYCSKA